MSQTNAAHVEEKAPAENSADISDTKSVEKAPAVPEINLKNIVDFTMHEAKNTLKAANETAMLLGNSDKNDYVKALDEVTSKTQVDIETVRENAITQLQTLK